VTIYYKEITYPVSCNSLIFSAPSFPAVRSLDSNFSIWSSRQIALYGLSGTTKPYSLRRNALSCIPYWKKTYNAKLDYKQMVTTDRLVWTVKIHIALPADRGDMA
jgi:hypothetical protein